MATKSIGYVVELVGGAQVRSVEGVIRVLSIGDQVHEGDILSTGLNTQIVLEFFDGHKMQIGENTEMLLDESVFAGLNAYPDERADQLAELQSLIVEGVDLAELEATAAGAASDSDALHQASVYSRVGDEGIVDTRLTPFNLGSPGLDNQSTLGDDGVLIPANSSEDSTAAAMLPPAASITVDSITTDDVINAVEAGAPTNVTGTVGGNVQPGDTVTFTVNSTPYSGTVGVGNIFSISVAAIDLVADNSFDATVSGTDIDGNPYSATITSTHTVDTTATATITLDSNITPDDIIVAAEALGTVAITGTVTGDFQAGDIVTLSINGVNTTGAVLANGSFSIDVNGSDLRNDPDSTIDASFVATDAAGNIAAPVTDTESYTVNNAPDSVDDVGALDGAEDSTTTTLNATMLSNDSDLDGDAISITAINGTALVGGVQSIAVANGTVNIDAGDNITFSADPNYNGPVSFDYTLSDGTLTDTATVSGTISAVNDAPDAVDDAGVADQDTVLSVPAVSGVLTNDTDLDGDTLTVSDVNGTGGNVGSQITLASGALLTLNSDGSYDYDPNGAFDSLAVSATTTDTFTYTVIDGNGASDSATVTITLTGTNDGITAVADTGATDQDVVLSVPAATGVLSNDTDLDGDTLTVSDVNGTGGNVGSQITLASGALLTLNSDGSYDYDPNGAFDSLAVSATTTDTFTYTVIDGNGASDSATVTITLTGTNDGITAVADTGATDQDVVLSVPAATGVLSNDTDLDGDTLSVSDVNGTGGNVGSQITLASGALLTLNADGSYDYDPNGSFDGLAVGVTTTDSFTYTVIDGNGASDSATVTITLTGTNDGITAVADTGATDQDTVLSVPAGTGVLTNDTDLDGDTLSVSDVNGTGGNVGSQITLTSGALLTLNADGSYDYDPNGSFDGLAVGVTTTDSFTYTVIDGNGASDSATVTITLTGTNDGITAVADTGATDQDTVLSVPVGTGVLTNDTDLDGDTLTVSDVNGTGGNVGSQITLASGALLTLNADGSYDYDPNGAFDSLAVGITTTDTFTYTVIDGNGASDSATVTITLTGTNDGITAVADTGATDQDTVLSVPVGTGVLTNDTDLDGDTLSVSDVNGTGGNVGSQITLASGALLTLNADGSYDYDPNGSFDGLAVGVTTTDSFTYTVIDGNGASDSATVTITLTGTNDGITAVADTGATDSDIVLSVPAGTGVLTNDTDLDGDTLTVSDVNGTGGNVGSQITLASGALLTLNADGSYDYDPNGSFDGLAVGVTTTDSFTYTVIDGNGASDSATVTITLTGTNDGITAVADTGATDQDTVLSVPAGTGVLTNDTDLDGDTLTVSDVNGTGGNVGSQITLASGALLTLNADGSYDYDPNGSFDGLAVGVTTTDSFTYTVIDGNGASDSATVTITLTGTNDGITAVADTGATDQDVVLSVPAATGVLSNDTDLDGDTLSVSDVNGTGGNVGSQITLASGALLTLNSDGSYDYDPNGAFDSLAVSATTTDTFTYTVIDGNGASDSATVTITLTGTNDGITAVADTGATDQDVVLSVPAAIGVLSNDTDLDGDTLTVSDVNGTGGNVGSQITLASGALLTLNADGSYDYDPNGSFDGLAVGVTTTDSFTYTVIDGNGASDSATVTITLTGTNDGITAVADTGATDQDTVLSVPAGTGVLTNDTDLDGDTLTVSDVNGTGGNVGSQITLTSGALLTLNADGSYDYDPNGAFDSLAVGITTTDTFTYTVIDGNGASDSATVTITLTGTNDGITAVADTGATDQDTVLSVPAGTGVLTNDTDLDGDTLTVSDVNGTGGNVGSQITLTSGALLTLNADGSYDYDPNGAFDSLAVGITTTDTFTYTVIDGNGASDSATVTITLTGTNDGITAVADTGATDQDVVLSVPAATGVLSNDTDLDGDTLTVSDVNGTGGNVGSQITLASGALLTLNADGSYDYDPNGSFDGLAVGVTTTDSFTYTVIDGNGASDSATVTITLTGTNDGITAVADTGATDQDTVLSVPAGTGVLTNDTDLDGDTLTVSDVNGTGGNVGSQITLASGALLTLNADGSYDYDPNGSFDGLAVGVTTTDSFTYTVIDGNGASDSATVTITLTGTNDGITAVADTGATDQDVVLSVPAATGVLSNDTDLDGDTLSVSDVNGTGGNVGSQITLASGALLTLNSDGSYDYDPNGAFDSLAVSATTTDTFTYTVIDGNGASDSATVTITLTGTNDGITAVADTGATDQDVVLSVPAAIGVLSNDTDLDGDTLTVSDVNGTGGNVGSQITLASGALLTLNADGSYDYDPNGSFDGLAVGVTTTDSFTYTVIDGNGASDSATVTITLTGTNDDITAVADTGATDQDTVLSVPVGTGVLTNDTDLDGDTLTVSDVNGTGGNVGSQITLASGALLTLNADGSYDYDPNGAFDSLAVGITTTDTFTYTVIDGNGASDSATVTITLTGTNDGITAVADTGATDQDTVLSVPVGTGVLTNDTDLDGDTLSVSDVNGTGGNVGSQITLTSGALLTLNSDGSYDYDPNGAFDSLAVSATTTDTFTYTVIDGNGASDSATVTITLTGTNDGITAVADTGATDQDVVLSVPAATGVLSNDTDLDGDTLSVSDVNGTGGNVGSQITLASGALLTLNADGSYDYDPNGSFDGLAVGVTTTDSFTYTVIDGNGASDSATVTITLTGTNDGITAVADTGATDQDTVLSVPVGTGVLTNDTDLDGDTLSVSDVNGTGGNVGSQITLTSGALLTLNADGSYDYDPNGAFDSLAVGITTTDTFTYTVIDGNGASDSATVTITLTGTNDGITAVADTGATDQDVVLSVPAATGVLSNDTDLDGDTLTVSDVNGTGGNVGSQITLASGALLTLNSDGSYDYDPNDVFDGLAVGATNTDSFTYTVIDGNGASATETVTITITGTNDGITAVADTGATDQDVVLSVPAATGVLSNDTDLDGDTLSVSDVNGTGGNVGSQITLASGALLTLNADGSYDYDPNGSFDGLAVGVTTTDSFTYTVIDGNGASDSATVTITLTGTNDGITAVADTGATDQDTVLSVPVGTGVLTNDTDLDGDTLSVSDVNGTGGNVGSQITLASGALLTINADGSYDYDPNGSFDGLAVGVTTTDSFTYTVIDGNGASDSATVTITLTGTNDGITAVADTGATDQDTVLSVPVGTGVLTNDTDLDGDTLTVSDVNGTGGNVGSQITLASGALLTLNADGSYDYDPNGAFDSLAVGITTTDTFTYTVIDGNGASDSATVTITLTGTNDGITAVADTGATDQDVVLSVPAATGVLSNDTDLDGDTLSVSDVNGTGGNVGSQITLTSGALLTLNSDGSYDYDPNGAFDSLAVGITTTDTFTYTVIDGNGASDSATVTITLTGTNDGITAVADTGATDQDTVLSVPVGTGVLTNDTDLDGDTLSVSDVNGTGGNVGSQITLTSGALLTLNSDGSYDYDPNGAFDSLAVSATTTDSFTYTVIDGNGASDSATVTITLTGTNDGITAVADTGATDQDVVLSVPAATGVLSNDTDLDGDTLSVSDVNGTGGNVGSQITLTSGALLTLNSDGSYDYDPNGAFDSLAVSATTTDTFTYTVIDGNGASDSATVTITLTGTNDGITAVADTGATDQDVVLSVPAATGVLSNDTDLDGDTLSVSDVNGTGGNVGSQITLTSGALLTLNSDGSYDYDPNGAFDSLAVGITTTDTFTYTVIDGNGASDSATVTITLTGTNDGITAVADTGATDQDTVLSVPVGTGVLTNDTDLDGDTLSVSDVNGTGGNVGSQITLTSGALLTLNADGSYDYDPNGSFDGLAVGVTTTDSFTYTVIDGNGASDSATVTITLTGTNDGITAVADSGATDQDTVLSVPVGTGVLTNDTDLDGDTLTVSDVNGTGGNVGSQITLASGALLTLNADGSYDYDPNGAFDSLAVGITTTDTFTYTVIDGNGASDSATVTITLTGTNDGITAVADTGATDQDTVLSVPVGTGVLTNDTDLDGDTLSVSDVNGTGGNVGSQITLASGALLTLNADGSYDYDPNGSFDGLAVGVTTTDSFTYTVIDGNGASDSATVTITLTGTNDGITAVADTGATDQDTVLSVPVGTGVLTNDTDLDGDTLSVSDVNGTGGNVGSQITLASGALLTLNADGSYDYDPNGSFDGLAVGVTTTDSFTYTVIDGNGASDSATVTITLTGTNDGITAVADTGATDQDTVLSVPVGTGVLTNDTDLDGDTLTVSDVNGTGGNVGSQITLASGALLTLNADGSYDYDPNGAFDSLAVGITTTDTFTYTVIDGNGASDSATVTITLTGTNDGITAVADTGATDQDTVLSVPVGTGVLTNDTDLDGDTLSVSDVNGTGGNVGSQITLTSGALLTLNSDGSYDYDPNGAFDSLAVSATTTDTFTYTVIDGNGASDSATVTITLTGTNDGITAVADTGATDQDVVLSVPAATGVLSNDTDLDGDTLSVSDVNGTGGNVGSQITLASGALLTLNADGSYDYDPNGSFDGLAVGVTTTDSFTYTVIDGNGASDSATVTITLTGTNDGITAVADTGATDQDTVLSVPVGTGVLTNDTDLDGDTLSVSDVNGTGGNVGSQITLTSGALLTLNADGSYDYDPNGAFDSLAVGITTTDTFTYTVIDGNGASDSATVTITLTGTNDGITAVADTGATDQDTVLSVPVGTGVLTNDTDLDGDTLSVSDVNGTGGNVGSQITLTSGALLTLNSDGSYDYDPNGAFDSLAVSATTTDSFTYTVIDGNGASDSATVTITLTGTNDGITAVADTGATDQDVVLSVPAATGVLSNDTDLDGDTLSVSDVNGTGGNVGSQITLTSGALLTLNSDGSYDYDPNGAFDSLAVSATTTDTFTYTVIDGNGASDSATVTITLTGTNDGITAVADTGATDQDVVLSVPAATGVLSNDTDLDGDTLSVSDVNGTGGNVGSQITLTSGALLTLNSDGSYDYDPNGAFDSLAVGITTTDTFTYTVIDGNGASDSATVTITLTGTNDGITAVADTGATDQDTVLSVPVGTGVLTNDTDLDGDTLSVSDVNGTGGNVGSQITLTSGALLTLNADGSYDYDPNGAFDSLAVSATTTDSFTYTVIDGNGASDSATVTITLTGTNDGITAVADSGATDQDTVLSVPAGTGVLTNDTDLDGDTLTVSDVNGTGGNVGSQITLTSGALLTLNADGSYDYDPNGSFDGLAVGVTTTDSFTYTVIDGNGASDSATVTITLTGTNDGITAVADSGATDQDTVLSVPAGTGVLTNDTDLDGDTLTVSDVNGTGGNVGSQITLTSGALLTLNADGSYDYDPNGSFDGLAVGVTTTDSFTYTVIDGNGASDSATVTITLTGTNDGITAVADSGATDQDTVLSVPAGTGVLTNDTDLDGDTLSVSDVNGTGGNVGSQITLASGALLTLNDDGSYDYDPNGSFDGLAVGVTTTDSFTYTVIDGNGASDSATVTITLTGTNDAPIIDLDNDDSAAAGSDYAVTFTEGGSAAYIADTDIIITDVDSTNLTGATITVNSVESGDLLTVGSMPAGITASAYDSVTGTITLSGTASLSDYQDAIRAIQFSNDGSTTNTTRSIDVVVTDGSNNSNTATTAVTIVTLPTVSITDVSVQEPAAGTTALTFTISIDQTLGSDLTFDYQTADISALAGADFVGISSTVGTITAGSNSTTVTVTVNSDADVFEGDETLSLDLINFNQTVNFDIAAHTISGGVQGIGTIGVNNGPPDAVDDSYITTVDTPLVITNALANDTLVDNAVVDVTGYTDLGSGVYSFNGNNGTVVYDSNTGDFTFTPSSGYTGTADFSYTLIDDDGETDTATVSVDVSSVVVSPPVVSNVPDTAYTENDSPVSLISGVNITDVDSTNLSSVVVTIDGFIGSQDILNYLTAGTSVVASVAVSGSTWELTLTGGVDINEYETVLDSITYQNSSENPSTSVRNITIEAFDQSYANLFGSDAGTLSISAVNDAPDVFDSSVFVLDGSSDNALNIPVPTDPDTDDNLLVITITGLPAGVGTVTLADGTPVAVGNPLTMTELAGLQFDAGATPGQGTLTYDVFDGSLTTSATTTVNVGSTEADIGTVYESELSNGTGAGGGSDTVTGNLFANDAAATPTSTLDNVNGTAPTSGVITINTAIGTLTVYADNTTPGFSAGDYVYVLNSADGSSNDVDEVFTYTFTEGVPLSDTLTISVIDDSPVANDVVQDVPESEEKVFNIIFTLDDSGSMAWGSVTGDTTPPASEPTRMDVAKESLSALGAEYFNQSTQVEITLVTFNSNASFVGTYSDFAAFEAALNAVTPGGGTNYVDATDEIQTQLVADLAGQNPADDVQNISYFISDGEANSGTSPIGSGYIEFVNNNSIDSYSVGIGSSLPGDLSDLNYIHNIDSLGQGGGTVDEALIVTDVSELESELLSTVPTAFGGNITANGSVSNVLFGADGGYVQSFTTDLGGTDYTFSYDGSTVTVPAALAATVVVNGSTIELGSDDGFAFGTFTFNFADGAYTLSAPNGMAPSVFDFDYTIIDGDGDTASATATINIIDDAPDARDDLDSLEAYEVAEGNVITALGTDGGPQFGSNISPFTSQGGGVDKIVDDAVVTDFTYKGSTISIASGDFTVVSFPDPTGNSENVEVNSQANINSSNFTISGFSGGSPDTLGFDTGGGTQGVGVGNSRLNSGESLVIDFDLTELPYGADNLTLTMNDYSGGDAVDITVYAINGTTVLASFTHNAGSGTDIDLSAFSGVGSVQIDHNNGNDSMLQFIDYDPAPAPASSITPAGGDNGSNLTWVYGYETDLDGNGVYQATVTDSSDGSEFIMRSNGFYQFTPDQTGGPIDVSTNTTSQANVDADPNINLSIRAGGSSLVYNADGVGVSGGDGQLLSSGEALLIAFDAIAAPDGVNNLILQLNDFQSGNNDQATVIVTHDSDGDGNLSTDTIVLSASGSSSETLDLSQFSGVTQFDIEYTGTGFDLGLGNISYEIPPVSPSTNLDPVLVDYVLTDTDGQSDTAQLALYTIDQTITGTSGIDNIAGGSLNDAIIGDDGDDILSGNAGNDSLSGGAGDDTLSGGVGNDYLSGGDGLDSLSGGIGSDTLDGGAGDDIVDGSSGDDVVLGGDGDDLVYGGSGDDRLEGGSGDDVLSGGSGNDVIFGDAGDDRINGGSGNDSLVGGDGIDIFALESGDEGTVGVPAVDTIADFTIGVGGDVLDLSDMLVDEELGSLDDYMSFNYNAGTGDTTISIDVDGLSGGSGTAQQIVLSGVDLTAGGAFSTDQDILNNLLSNGNLIVDQ